MDSFPAEALQDELELLVREAGFTPLQAIEAATRQATKFLQLQDSLGVVAPGQIVDLLILDANPLAAIEHPPGQPVIQGGRAIK